MSTSLSRSKPAYDVFQGDRFSATVVPTLVVRSAVRGDDGRVHITFSDPDGNLAFEHDYAPHEPVFFPYPDRASRDWRLEDEAPTPDQLRIGDLLPSPDGDKVADKYDAFTEPQVVTSISLNRQLWQNKAGHIRVYDVVLYSVQTVVSRRYRFADGERVAFPKASITTDRPKSSGEVEWFGPYTNRETGCEWEFTMHPTGRGRWPRGIDPYKPDLPPHPNGLPRRARFPKYDWDANLEPSTPGLPVGHTRRGPRAPGLGWVHAYTPSQES